MLLAIAPARALAGGFEIPDTGARAAGRGGAMAASAEDATAIHYNPGMLARQRGTQLLYNHNLIFHGAEFTRAPLTEEVWGEDLEFGSVSDKKKLFPLGLFVVVTSDFGLENWTFAAGVNGPSAVGAHDYPEYGPQSFMLTDMNVLLAYYNVAAAWKLRDVFGVGLTFQWVDMIQMNYALVADTAVVTDLNPVPDATSTQAETELQLKDHTAATALLGVWYRPHQRVEIGASSRVVPVFLRPKGKVAVDKDTVNARDVTAEMKLVLPANLRVGARYIHEVGEGEKRRRWFDLELDVVYENWSVIDSFDLKFTGTINGMPVQNLTIEKGWKDTVSVRLGSDIYALPPWFTVRAGGFWESPTQANSHSHLDFPAFMRGGVGAGFTAGGRGVYFTAGYMHVFQQKRDVSEAEGKVLQQRPLRPCPDGCGGLSGVPANAGTFKSRYDLLNLGIEFRFRELVGDRDERERRRKAKRERDGEPAQESPSAAPAPVTTPPPHSAPAAIEPTEPTPGSAPGSAPASAPEPIPEPAVDDDAPNAPDAPPIEDSDHV